MALKEYRDEDGRTYLFDEDKAPAGFELVADTPVEVTTVEHNEATETDEEKATREAAEAEDAARKAAEAKAAEAKANKQATAPENKQAAPAAPVG